VRGMASDTGLSERRLAIITLLMISFIIASSLVTTVPLPKYAIFKRPYLALVKIEGPLAYSSEYTLLSTSTGVEEYIELLKEVKNDPYARAVVLYVNSPGGTVSASEALYFAIKELAEKKITVAYIAGYGTSGAYMAVLPSRRIIASNSSLAGSIGVYMVLINLKDLLGKVGIKAYIFKSGRLKDLGSPFRSLTEEEKEVLKGLVDEYFRLFKQRVLKYRKGLTNSSEVFQGRPYLADEGKRLGLIDEVGTLHYALNIARNLSGLPEDCPVKVFKPRRLSLLELFLKSYGGISCSTPSGEILAMWPLPSPLPLRLLSNPPT